MQLLNPLPPGRHGLPRKQVAASQRARLLRAVVDAVGTKGYAATTIAEVTSLADVSKKTFYVYFDDKEECFLAAYDAFAAFVLEEMTAAYRAASGDWRQRYRAAVNTFLALLSAQPARTRALLVEVLAAGPNVLAQRRKVLQRFEDNLRDIHAAARARDPKIADLPPEVFAIAVGGIDELLRTFVIQGRVHDLPTLERTITFNFEWLLGRWRCAVVVDSLGCSNLGSLAIPKHNALITLPYALIVSRIKTTSD